MVVATVAVMAVRRPEVVMVVRTVAVMPVAVVIDSGWRGKLLHIDKGLTKMVTISDILRIALMLKAQRYDRVEILPYPYEGWYWNEHYAGKHGILINVPGDPHFGPDEYRVMFWDNIGTGTVCTDIRRLQFMYCDVHKPRPYGRFEDT